MSLARSLSSVASQFRAETLVYQFTGKIETRWLETTSPKDAWLPANEASIDSLFGADPARRSRFLHFHKRGYQGFFLTRDGQWINYGWCARPGTGGPPHLPRWAGNLGAYWIFYCHTREEFRSQGHHKRLMARIVAFARAQEPNLPVLCDTLPENFPSRTVALQSGFTPVGVLTTYRLWVPGLGGVALGGAWHRERAHAPQLEPLLSTARQ